MQESAKHDSINAETEEGQEMTDKEHIPTEGDEIATLLIQIEELEAEKARLNKQYGEEIKVKRELLMQKAYHSAQIPLPLG